MDDKKCEETAYRRLAIKQTLKGKRACEILKLIPRSRVWLRKWLRRYEESGWAGLESRSRRPCRSPQQYPKQTRILVLNLRRKFARRKVGLVGARAIRQEIVKYRLLRTVPCEATIKHWLKEADLIKEAAQAPEKIYYPESHFAQETVLHIMDWTARYIEGGEKIFAFHTLDAATRGLTETIRPNKSVQSVISHGLEVWRTLGLPDYLQIDNDSAFNGGEKTPRRFGAFTRLCLYLGIELIFIPPAEPQRNSLIESLHRLWAKSFWQKNHFGSIAQVQRKKKMFTAWYDNNYFPPALKGLTPAQAHKRVKRKRLTQAQIRSLPQPLPVTAGRLHFIRRVSPEGEISFLGESWRVSKRLVGQYVWAAVLTHKQRLEIYHRPSQRAGVRLVKAFDYAIAETVHNLRPEFHRRSRRPSMLRILGA